MILTVDIGNSNIVLGGVEGDEICFEARLRTDATKTSDEYSAIISRSLESASNSPAKENTPSFSSVIIACDMSLVNK